jgi:hypothetical protein
MGSEGTLRNQAIKPGFHLSLRCLLEDNYVIEHSRMCQEAGIEPGSALHMTRFQIRLVRPPSIV